MKKLAFLLLFLASCHDDTYPDLAGQWTFSSPEASGEFTTTKTQVTGGNFTIAGTKYEILTPTTFNFNLVASLVLTHDASTSLTLDGVTPSSKFDSMTATSIFYNVDGIPGIVNGPLTVTRKK